MRSATVEFGAGLAVLIIVAVIAGPGSTGHRAATPRPAWSAKGTAAVTALIGDITALQRDAATAGAGKPVGKWSAAMAADESCLEQDIAGARAFASPPSASVARQWSAALAQADSVLQASDAVLTLGKRGTSVVQPAVESLDVALNGAGDALLRLAARLELRP